MEYINETLKNNINILNYIKNNQDIKHLLINDPENVYNGSNEFTHLHKLVLLTNEHKLLIKYLELFLQSEEGINMINTKNNKGLTALMLACTIFNAETVKLLLDHKANINLQNNEGLTALMFACYNSDTDSNLEIVKLLLDYKADVNLQNNKGGTALMLACCNSNTCSNIETVQILLDYKANVNLQNNSGMTALMFACCNSNTTSDSETVALLLNYKANIELKTRNGETALMLACKFLNTTSNIRTIKLLLNHGANVNSQNKYGWSALMYLSYGQNGDVSEALKLLLDHGANKNLRTVWGSTPLDAALMSRQRTKNKQKTIEILSNYKPNLHSQNNVVESSFITNITKITSTLFCFNTLKNYTF